MRSYFKLNGNVECLLNVAAFRYLSEAVQAKPGRQHSPYVDAPIAPGRGSGRLSGQRLGPVPRTRDDNRRSGEAVGMGGSAGLTDLLRSRGDPGQLLRRRQGDAAARVNDCLASVARRVDVAHSHNSHSVSDSKSHSRVPPCSRTTVRCPSIGSLVRQCRLRRGWKRCVDARFHRPRHRTMRARRDSSSSIPGQQGRDIGCCCRLLLAGAVSGLAQRRGGLDPSLRSTSAARSPGASRTATAIRKLRVSVGCGERRRQPPLG